MGMNFFLVSKPCAECGHSRSELHIGKCSYGWSFSFQGYPEKNIMSYDDWLREIEEPGRVIRDENGEPMTIKDFKEMVEHKKDDKNHARIFKGINPLTEIEKEYVDHNLDRCDPAAYKDHHCWLDDKGNSFSGTYFR